jgi:porphobilinogen synthase
MLMAASQRGWLDQERVVMESLIACKRAGADAIFTYFAADMARRLKQKRRGTSV